MNARKVLAGAALAYALMASSAWAQYGTVRGKITDEKGAPLPESEVVLEGQGDVAGKKFTLKADKKGGITRVGLPRGAYKVTVSKEGYQAITLNVQISTGDTADMGDIKLTAAAGGGAAGGGKSNANAELNKAIELAQADKFDEAEVIFKEFLTKNPAHALAHYNLGYVQSRKKDYAGAEESFKKAIELDPSMPEPYTALAGVYQQTGKSAEALDLLTKAATAQPDNAQVQYNLGVHFVNTQQSDKAYAAFEKAAAANPEFAETYYMLGTTAINLNRIADAVKHLEKYISMSPSNAQNLATAKALVPELKKTLK
jgi:tetratricopeptide (TPR) repeat protein